MAEVSPDLPINFQCSQCGTAISAEPRVAGEQMSCPNCQSVIWIPQAMREEYAPVISSAPPVVVEPLQVMDVSSIHTEAPSVSMTATSPESIPQFVESPQAAVTQPVQQESS